jgi:hypothetical protein
MHILTFPFSPVILTKNNMTLISTHLGFLFPRVKTKVKGHHFDTSDVIETGLQSVLNTIPEHNFQNAFKKWQKLWEEDSIECDDGQ